METVTLTGQVVNGILTCGKHLADVLRACEGNLIDIRISEYKTSKTLPQLRFYYGVMRPIMVDCFREYDPDWNKETVHEHLKEEAGFVRWLTCPDGTRKKKIKSMADFSKEDSSYFIEWCHRFAVENGWNIPVENNELMAGAATRKDAEPDLHNQSWHKTPATH